MRRPLALAFFALGGCVAAEFAPLPTHVVLPTHTAVLTETPITETLAEVAPSVTITFASPVNTEMISSPSVTPQLAVTMPILLPTPPGAEAATIDELMPSPVPREAEIEPQTLSVALVGDGAAPQVQVLAALPTRALRPAPELAPAMPELAPPTIAPPTPIAVAVMPTAGLIQAPSVDLGALTVEEAALMNVPVFWQFGPEQVRGIIERGRAMGNNGQVFTTLGDSNSLSGDFLRPLVLENYCTWGGFAHLQEVVRYFSVPPAAGDASSFTHQSIAVQMGFNSAAALDPFWATDPRCAGGETPLACELRVTRPAVLIVMLGGKDVGTMSLDAYRTNMIRLVDEAIGKGVVPVLTTFVVLPGRDVYTPSLMFNQVLVDLARERGTPLINLWAAARALPDNGIASDGTHLRTNPGQFCDFTGGEREYGGTLRNLLTLQALDLLRVSLAP
ncbi:MAG: SGNH/GDSL hydrolase family protein [Chloroflexi bacterium]|nr:SGNH/GDSL hydrolase family protein [Chloroflexota bacterium]